MATIARSPCDDGVILTGDLAGAHAGDRRWVLAAAILGSSLAFIDGTVVNVALPALQSALGASLADVQWVVESYALTLAALLLPGGSLGDARGRKKIFVIGVALFAAASALCGVSRSVGELIAARAVQGIGAALLVPGSLALISASFPESERGRAIGMWSGATAITTAIGPVLGGWLVEQLSWRWVFYINLPLALAVIAIAVLHVPETKARGTRPIDWPGIALASAGLGLVVFGMVEGMPAAGVAGVALLTAFLVVERRSAAPMLPLTLFRSRDFSGANLLTFLLYTALNGVLFFFPLNLIQIQGYSATQAGAALLPFIVLMFLLSPWSGALVERYGPRLPLLIGPLVVAAAFALFAWPDIGGSYWTTAFPPVVVLGAGLAISVAPLTTTVMNAVPDNRVGVASGVNNAISRVAGVIAIAAFGLVVSQVFNRALDRELDANRVPPSVRETIDAQRDRLGAARTDDPAGQQAIARGFVAAYRWVCWVAVGLSVASAATAAVLIEPRRNVRLGRLKE